MIEAVQALFVFFVAKPWGAPGTEDGIDRPPPRMCALLGLPDSTPEFRSCALRDSLPVGLGSKRRVPEKLEKML
jgi:hypothetical protein